MQFTLTETHYHVYFCPSLEFDFYPKHRQRLANDEICITQLPHEFWQMLREIYR